MADAKNNKQALIKGAKVIYTDSFGVDQEAKILEKKPHGDGEIFYDLAVSHGKQVEHIPNVQFSADGGETTFRLPDQERASDHG